MQSVKIVVQGQIINYEQVGTGGKNLLILHGWGRSLREWIPIAQQLAEYRITLFDLPGFGGSEDPERVFDTYDYSNLVLECIKKLELDSLAILGHSFGGRIATVLAANHPEVISRVVLIDPGGVEIKSLKVKVKVIVYKLILKHFKKLLPKSIRRFFGSVDYRSISGVLQKSFVNIVNQDLRNLFSKIHQPVLVLWGSNDEVLPVHYVKIYKKMIPQAIVRIVWGARHSPHIDQFTETLRLLKEFL